MQSLTITIGTRGSQLAIYQAKQVATKLQAVGYATQIKTITTHGDIRHDKPLYAMGITGVFTRALDEALLNHEIDIAVHSLKDVPTILPEQIVQVAVLERSNTADVLVGEIDQLAATAINTIATSSLRRKAQWLSRYPKHSIVNIRGNLATRLAKIQHNAWTGAIFSIAGLQRLNILPNKHLVLDWMYPAPAQGTIAVHCLATNDQLYQLVKHINHQPTEQRTQVERDFLRHLEGGCTAPIGTKTRIDRIKKQLIFEGGLFSLNGQQKIIVKQHQPLDQLANLGQQLAEQVLHQGGAAMLEEIRQLTKAGD